MTYGMDQYSAIQFNLIQFNILFNILLLQLALMSYGISKYRGFLLLFFFPSSNHYLVSSNITSPSPDGGLGLPDF